jgi:hypothetical protein
MGIITMNSINFALPRAVVVLIIISLGGASFTVSADEESTRLYRQLVSKSETVRLQTIARVASDPKRIEQFDDLQRAAENLVERTANTEIVWPSTVELLYVIASCKTPESDEIIVRFLESKHPGIVMVAADALGKNRRHTAIESLKKLVDHSEFGTSYGFRFNLVRSLAQMQHGDATEFLGHLATQLDGQLRYEIDTLLSKADIESFDHDQARFEQFQKTRTPKIVLTSGDEDNESKQRLRLNSGKRYYDIDIHAKRIMFIIDHSGSMREVVNGITRLDQAKSELLSTIVSLPEETEFSILFYSDSVHLWRHELQRATPENKQLAMVFVNRLGLGSRTNTYGALREALQFDESLEGVFLLTDGRPTSGEIVAPAMIISDILHRNRFRHLKFNTIGIALDGPTKEFLRSLAENTAGEFRQVQ